MNPLSNFEYVPILNVGIQVFIMIMDADWKWSLGKTVVKMLLCIFFCDICCVIDLETLGSFFDLFKIKT